MSWARLPSWLWPTAEILNFGQAYPNGDPDQMRALGDQWSGFADRLEGWIGAIKNAVRNVGAHLIGDGQAAFHQQSDYMISDGQTNLESTVASMRQVQGMTYNAATSIDYTQQQQDFFCAMAAYQVIQLAQTLAGSAAIPGVYAAFRQLVQLASRDCAEVVARDAAADAIAAMLAEQAPKVFEEIGANLTREAARDLGEKAAQTLGRDGLSTIGRDTVGELGAGAARDAGENTLGQGARAAGRDVTADVLGQGGRAAARDVAVDVLERGGSAAGRNVTAEALAQAGGAAGRHALTDLASDGARDLVGQQLGDAAARDGAGLITKVGGDVAAKSAEKLLLKPLAEDAAKTAGEQEAKKEAEGFSLKALAKKAALEGAKQAGQGAALDLGIQADQIARGRRSGFDAEQFMSTSLSWGGGVILGHPAGEVVGEKLAERGFVTRFVAGVGTAAALNVPGMALGDTVGRAIFQAGEAGLGVLDPAGNHHADWSHVTFGLNPQQFLAIGGMHGVGMFTHDLAVRRGIVAGDFGQVDEMFGNLAIRSVPTDGTGPDNAFRQDYQRRLGAAYFDAQAKAKSGNPIPLKAFQRLREELDTRQGVTSDRRTGALSNPSAGPANRTAAANGRTGATNGRAPHGATATNDRTSGPTRGAMAGPRGADASGGPVVIHRAESAVSHSESAIAAGSGVVRAQASDGASAGTSVQSDAVVSQSEPAIAASAGEVRPPEPDVVVPQSEPVIVTSSSDIRAVVQNNLGTDAAVPQREMASVAVGGGLRGEMQHGAGSVTSSISEAAAYMPRSDTSVSQSDVPTAGRLGRGGGGDGPSMPDAAGPHNNSSTSVGGNGGREGAVPERGLERSVPQDVSGSAASPPAAGEATGLPIGTSEPIVGTPDVGSVGRPAAGHVSEPGEVAERSGERVSTPEAAGAGDSASPGVPSHDHGVGSPGEESPAAADSPSLSGDVEHVESASYGELHEAVVDAREQAEQRWIGALADVGVDVAAADPAAVAALRDAAAKDHMFVGRNGSIDRGPREAARREFTDAARALGIDLDATDPAALRAVRDAAVRDREIREQLDHLNRAAEQTGDETDPSLLAFARAILAHHAASVRFDEATADLPEHAAWLLRSPANRLGAVDTLPGLLSGRNNIELTDAQRAEVNDAVIGYHLTGVESATARAEIDAAHAEGDGSASNAAPASPGRLRRGLSGMLPSLAHGAEDLPAGENVEPSPAAARPSAEHLASMDGSVPKPATAEQGEHRAEPAVAAESESGAGNILRRPDENARPAVAAQHSPGESRRAPRPDLGDGSRPPGRPHDAGNTSRAGAENHSGRGDSPSKPGLGLLGKLKAAFPKSRFLKNLARVVGPEGAYSAELMGATGGKFREFPRGEAEIVAQLNRMGPKSMALVAESFRGPADKFGVGGQLRLLENRGGTIVEHILDPDGVRPFVPGGTQELSHVKAILVNDRGVPLDRIGGRARRLLLAEGEAHAQRARQGAIVHDVVAGVLREVLSAGGLDPRLPAAMTGKHVLDALSPHADPQEARRIRKALSDTAFGRDLLLRLGERPIEGSWMRDGRPNVCGLDVLGELRAMYPGADIRMFGRPIDEYGISADELRAAIGGQIGEYSDHEGIANELRRLGPGSSAAVIDTYAGMANESNHFVGAHTYLVTYGIDEHGNDYFVVRDRGTGRAVPDRVVEEHGVPLGPPYELTRRPKAIFLDGQGSPADPLTVEKRSELLHRLFDPTAAGRIGIRVVDGIEVHVRKLLEQTAVGSTVLDSLVRLPVRERYPARDRDGSSHGSFEPDQQQVNVYTSGRTIADMASTLVHEATHAEEFANGTSVRDPLSIPTREDYVRANVEAEVRCNLRQAQFERELEPLGYIFQPKLVVTEYENEHALAMSQGATPDEANKRAMDKAVAYLGDAPSPDGRSYNVRYGDHWDFEDGSANLWKIAGGTPPKKHSIEGSPEEIGDAAAKQIWPLAADRNNDLNKHDEIDDALTNSAAELGISVSGPDEVRILREMIDAEPDFSTVPTDQQPELRRRQHRLTVLMDLVEQRTNLAADVGRENIALNKLAAAAVVGTRTASGAYGTRLSDHAYLTTGRDPSVVVITGPGEHADVLGDPAVAREIAGLPPDRVVRETVEVAPDGTVICRATDQYPDIRYADDAVESEQRVEQFGWADRAAEKRWTEIVRQLERTPLGQQAVDTMRGVRISHTDDPLGQRYEALSNQLVLDAGLSDDEYMAAIVQTATHVRTAGVLGPEGVIERRDGQSPESYIRAMLEEHQRAQASEIVWAMERLDAGLNIRVPEGVQEYIDACSEAWITEAHRVRFPGAARMLDSERAALDWTAHKAGVRALRPVIESHLDNGEFYRDIYLELQDRLQGEAPFDEHVLDQLRRPVRDEQPLTVFRAVDGLVSVEKVILADGTPVIRLQLASAESAAAVELSSRVARALGLDVPEAVAVGDKVYLSPRVGFDGGQLLGLFRNESHPPALDVHDALVGAVLSDPWDRVGVGDQNAWLNDHLAFGVDPSNRPLNDNARTFLNPDGTAKRHSMTVSEVRRLREMMRALRPDFERLGRSDWHESMMRRIDDLEAHARSDQELDPEHPEPFRQQATPSPQQAGHADPGGPGAHADPGGRVDPSHAPDPGDPDEPTAVIRPRRTRLTGSVDPGGHPQLIDPDEPPTRRNAQSPGAHDDSSDAHWDSRRGVPERNGRRSASPMSEDGSRSPQRRRWGMPWTRRSKDPVLPDVSGRIEPRKVELPGPNGDSVAGVVTAISPRSRLTTGGDGVPELVLSSVEARGPDHIDLGLAVGVDISQAMFGENRSAIVRVESNGHTVDVTAWYRDFDNGKATATVIYHHPQSDHPEFLNVRRMVDAALQDRFPGRRIDLFEVHTRHGGDDPFNRVLEPGSADAAGAGSGHAVAEHDPGSSHIEAPERRAPGDAANNAECGIRALRRLLLRFGERSGIRLPARLIGVEGMSRDELVGATGGRLEEQFTRHTDVADRVPDGGAALVVDMYGRSDGNRVGGHAYLLWREGDRITVEDLGTGEVHEDLSRLSDDVESIGAIFLDHEGVPVDRIDEPTRERLLREAQEQVGTADWVGVGRNREPPGGGEDPPDGEGPRGGDEEESSAEHPTPEAAEQAARLRRAADIDQAEQLAHDKVVAAERAREEADADPGDPAKQEKAKQAEWNKKQALLDADLLRTMSGPETEADRTARMARESAREAQDNPDDEFLRRMAHMAEGLAHSHQQLAEAMRRQEEWNTEENDDERGSGDSNGSESSESTGAEQHSAASDGGPAQTGTTSAEEELRVAFAKVVGNYPLTPENLARVLAGPGLTRSQRRELAGALLKIMAEGPHSDSIAVARGRSRLLRALKVPEARIRKRPVRVGGKVEKYEDKAGIRHGRHTLHENQAVGPSARKVAAALGRRARRGGDAVLEPLTALIHAVLHGDPPADREATRALRPGGGTAGMVPRDEWGRVPTDAARIEDANQRHLEAARAQLDWRRAELLRQAEWDAAEAVRPRVEAERALRDAIAEVNQLEAAAGARGEMHTAGVNWAQMADPQHGELAIANLRDPTLRLVVGDTRQEAYDELEAAFRAYQAAAHHEATAVTHMRAIAEQIALRTVSATSVPGLPDVGVIDGPRRRVAVVLWGDSQTADDVLDRAAEHSPEIGALAGDRTRVVVLRVVPDEHGHLAVQREEHPDSAATTQDPNDPNANDPARARLEELRVWRAQLERERADLLTRGDALAVELDLPGARNWRALGDDDFGEALRQARERDGVQDDGERGAVVRDLINTRTALHEHDRRIASLDREVEALTQDSSLRSEHDRLVRRWADLRKRQQAAQEQLAELADKVHVHELTGSGYDQAVLARLHEAQERRIVVPATLDFPGAVEHRATSPNEIAQRRLQIRKLMELVTSIDNIKAEQGKLEERLQDLAVHGIGDGIPHPPELAEKMLHLDAERVKLLENPDAGRTMLLDRLRRNGVHITDAEVDGDPDALRAILNAHRRTAAMRTDGTGPDVLRMLEQLERNGEELRTSHSELRARLADVLDRLRRNGVDVTDAQAHGDASALRKVLDEHRARAAARTDGTEPHVRSMLDELGRIADALRPIENHLGRLDDEAARLTGRWDRALSDRGLTKTTERVVVLDEPSPEPGAEGPPAPPRIIVLGPRLDTEGDRAEFDRELQRAIEQDPRVARAMLARPLVEYWQMVSGPERVHPEPLSGPGSADTRYYEADPGRDRAPVRLGEWRDSVGRWHPIDPDMAGRRSRPTPKELADYKDKMYEEGAPQWWGGLVQYINSLDLLFAHIPPDKVAQDLLPSNMFVVGAGKSVFNDTGEEGFSPHIGGEINFAQRQIRNLFSVLKVPRVQRFIQNHPGIGDKIFERPWLKRKAPFTTMLDGYAWHRGAQQYEQPMFPIRHHNENTVHPARVEWPAEVRSLYDRLRNRSPEEVLHELRARTARAVVTKFRTAMLRHGNLESAIEEFAPAFGIEDPETVRKTLTDLDRILSESHTAGPVQSEVIDRVVNALTPHMRSGFAGGDPITDLWQMLSWTDQRYETYRADPHLADKIVAGLDQHKRNERVLAARTIVQRIRQELIDEVPPAERMRPESVQRPWRGVDEAGRMDAFLAGRRDEDFRNLKYRNVKTIGDLTVPSDGLSRFRRIFSDAHTNKIAEESESLVAVYKRLTGEALGEDDALSLAQMRMVLKHLLIGDCTDSGYADQVRQHIDDYLDSSRSSQLRNPERDQLRDPDPKHLRDPERARLRELGGLTIAEHGSRMFGGQAADGLSQFKRISEAFRTEDPDAVHEIVGSAYRDLVGRMRNGEITDEMVNQVAEGIADEMREDYVRQDYVAFTDTPPPLDLTREQVQQVLDHLMVKAHWVVDHLDPDGRLISRRMDQVADVAEAIDRLISVEPVGDTVIPRLRHPLMSDVILLRDALAEAEHTAANDTKTNPFRTWDDANAAAAAQGFDWDSVRPPRTDWRAEIVYRSDLAELMEGPRALQRLEDASVVLDRAARALGRDPQDVLEALAHDPARSLLNALRERQTGREGLDRVEALGSAIEDFRSAERTQGPNAKEQLEQAGRGLDEAVRAVGEEPDDVRAALARDAWQELVDSLQAQNADPAGVTALEDAVRERNEALTRLAHATRGAENPSRLHTGLDPMETILPGDRSRLALPEAQARLERASAELDAAAAGLEDPLVALGGDRAHFDALRAAQPDAAGRIRVDELQRAVHEFRSAEHDLVEIRDALARAESTSGGRAESANERLAPYRRALREAREARDDKQGNLDRRRDLLREAGTQHAAGTDQRLDAEVELALAQAHVEARERELQVAQDRLDAERRHDNAAEAGEPMTQGTRAPEQPRGDAESLRRQIQDLTAQARRADADPAGAVLDCQRARGMLRELRDQLESELAQRRALLTEAAAAREEAAGAVGPHVPEPAVLTEEAHLRAQGEVTRLEDELAQVGEQGRELADLHAGIDQRLEDARAQQGSVLANFDELPHVPEPQESTPQPQRPGQSAGDNHGRTGEGGAAAESSRRSTRVTGDGTAGHTGPHAHARPDGTDPRTAQSDSGRGRPSGMDPSAAQVDSGRGRRSASGSAHLHGDGTRTNDPVADHNSGSGVHPAEGSVAGAGRGGQCAVQALRDLLGMFGRISGIRLPSRLVGLEGMSEGEIAACAGGKFGDFVGGRGDVAAELLGTPEEQARGVKRGAAALVVEMFSSRDADGVGGHAFLMVNEGNRIVVRDLGAVEEFTGRSPRPGDAPVKAILFGPDGRPVDPIDDGERDRMAQDAIRQLGDANRVGIGRPRESPGEGDRAGGEESTDAEGGGGQPPTVHHDPPPPDGQPVRELMARLGLEFDPGDAAAVDRVLSGQERIDRADWHELLGRLDAADEPELLTDAGLTPELRSALLNRACDSLRLRMLRELLEGGTIPPGTEHLADPGFAVMDHPELLPALRSAARAFLRTDLETAIQRTGVVTLPSVDTETPARLAGVVRELEGTAPPAEVDRLRSSVSRRLAFERLCAPDSNSIPAGELYRWPDGTRNSALWGLSRAVGLGDPDALSPTGFAAALAAKQEDVLSQWTSLLDRLQLSDAPQGLATVAIDSTFIEIARLARHTLRMHLLVAIGADEPIPADARVLVPVGRLPADEYRPLEELSNNGGGLIRGTDLLIDRDLRAAWQTWPDIGFHSLRADVMADPERTLAELTSRGLATEQANRLRGLLLTRLTLERLDPLRIRQVDLRENVDEVDGRNRLRIDASLGTRLDQHHAVKTYLREELEGRAGVSEIMDATFVGEKLVDHLAYDDEARAWPQQAASIEARIIGDLHPSVLLHYHDDSDDESVLPGVVRSLNMFADRVDVVMHGPGQGRTMLVYLRYGGGDRGVGDPPQYSGTVQMTRSRMLEELDLEQRRFAQREAADRPAPPPHDDPMAIPAIDGSAAPRERKAKFLDFGDYDTATLLDWHLKIHATNPEPLPYVDKTYEVFGRTIEVRYLLGNLSEPGHSVKDEMVRQILEFGETDENIPIVAITTGNYGYSLALKAREMGRRIIIFTPETANPVKVKALEDLGVEVKQVGSDYSKCHEYVENVWAYDNDGLIVDQEAASQQAAMHYHLNQHIIDHPDEFGTVFVPVGNGSFAGTIVESLSGQAIDVVGVAPQNAPAFVDSFEYGDPVVRPSHTIADSAAHSEPTERMVHAGIARTKYMMEVSEKSILPWTRMLSEELGHPVDPTAALASFGPFELYRRKVAVSPFFLPGRAELETDGAPMWTPRDGKMLVYITGGRPGTMDGVPDHWHLDLTGEGAVDPGDPAQPADELYRVPGAELSHSGAPIPAVPEHDNQPPPNGLYRGQDGLLHVQGDRPDTYRTRGDRRLHHITDPEKSWRDKGFNLRDSSRRENPFLNDHLSSKGIVYKAQKGESSPYRISDEAEQNKLTAKTLVRQMQQSLRDPIGVRAKTLMAEFDIEDINKLTGDKVPKVIAERQTAVRESSLDEREKLEKLARLRELRGIAWRYHKIGENMVKASKSIGDIPGFAYANDPAEHPDAVIMHPIDEVWDGNDSFDVPLFMPARDGEPPIFKTIENKGVGSSLGKADTPAGGAEQGSPEYQSRTLALEKNLARVLRETPEDMRRRGIDPSSPAAQRLLWAKDELLRVFHDGTLAFQAELAHTDINGFTTITPFDLERDGVPLSIQNIGGIEKVRTSAVELANQDVAGQRLVDDAVAQALEARDVPLKDRARFSHYHAELSRKFERDISEGRPPEIADVRKAFDAVQRVIEHERNLEDRAVESMGLGEDRARAVRDALESKRARTLGKVRDTLERQLQRLG
ncbi:cysteine synthase [Nocardia sp. GAS34]|uniref:pyridoxal-phosphate dependent enzyme n=1 Tax=unclassified Nocardia TaxID=2637762 RepID=UPI003D217B72